MYRYKLHINIYYSDVQIYTSASTYYILNNFTALVLATVRVGILVKYSTENFSAPANTFYSKQTLQISKPSFVSDEANRWSSNCL